MAAGIAVLCINELYLCAKSICMEGFPSRLLEDAINEFASLPGIGKKTATRLVLHLLKKDQPAVESFGKAMIRLRSEAQYCSSCHTISDTPVCHICADHSRDHQTICVVEDIRDVLAIENTRQYRGVYHVLGGKISPMDGIGPSDLFIETLVKRVENGGIQEVILALSTTMEGDTTNFYVYRKISVHPVQITTIARGIAFGDELEYADELTLGRSILNRTPYEKSLAR